MLLSRSVIMSISYQSVEEVKQAYNFHKLQSFLTNIYYAGARVLIHEQEFHHWHGRF